MVHESGVHAGRVGVEVALLQPVDDNPRRWRRDFQIVVDDASSVKGKEHLALLGIATFIANSNLSEEFSARVCDADKQKEQRCSNGGVDAVFDRGKDCDKNSRQPDEEFEGRNAPVGVHLSVAN